MSANSGSKMPDSWGLLNGTFSPAPPMRLRLMKNLFLKGERSPIDVSESVGTVGTHERMKAISGKLGPRTDRTRHTEEGVHFLTGTPKGRGSDPTNLPSDHPVCASRD